MLAFAKWHLHQTIFDAWREVKKPFGNKRRLQMGDGKTRPIKNPFRHPVIKRCVTLRFTSRGGLRQVRDCWNTGFFRGLGEVGGCVYNTRDNWIHKKGS